MALFKKKDDNEWNIWDDDYEDVPLYEEKIEEASYDYEDISPKKMSRQKFSKPKEPKQPKKKKISNREKKKQEKIREEIDYFSNPDNIYEQKASISYGKVFAFLTVLIVVSLGVIGYLNTDFDENQKAYVVSYDLHYERDYVKQSDEVLNYLIELHKDLPTILPSLQSNTITTTEEINNMIAVLDAKIDGLSRYTRVPSMMESYNDKLISLAMSTSQMLSNALVNYTSSDYIAWAESAYYDDFEPQLNTMKILREEITTIIYRNIEE